jgi:GH43 family beta-xylosidase
MHRINNKWYIYFAADDGNMDNHQIYVIENEADIPTEGKFVMKGRIPTDKDNNWAIHASTFEHNGQRYMIWCGWQKRRIDSETQCIYIASMENPWTLSSDRVLISKPEYEWECQWVNPDGSKTAYPIHVNEAPHFFQPKNKDKVCIFYSASGSWTPYYCVGLLTADANANLLDPTSWKKHPTPVFQQEPENEVFGPGGSSFVSSPDGKECYMLYHALHTLRKHHRICDTTPIKLRFISALLHRLRDRLWQAGLRRKFRVRCRKFHRFSVLPAQR